MPGVLTTLAASVIAGVVTLSVAGCATPPPEKPKGPPSNVGSLMGPGPLERSR